MAISEQEWLTTHEFTPYYWDKLLCGYIDGDDNMCGAFSEEHQPLENKTDIKQKDKNDGT